jgi:hypothetical protein
MRTPLRRSIARVLKIARAGGRSLRQRIWSDAYRFPRAVVPASRSGFTGVRPRLAPAGRLLASSSRGCAGGSVPGGLVNRVRAQVTSRQRRRTAPPGRCRLDLHWSRARRITDVAGRSSISGSRNGGPSWLSGLPARPAHRQLRCPPGNMGRMGRTARLPPRSRAAGGA